MYVEDVCSSPGGNRVRVCMQEYGVSTIHYIDVIRRLIKHLWDRGIAINTDSARRMAFASSVAGNVVCILQGARCCGPSTPMSCCTMK
jgi:hypothetical protein